ncbi:RagB/SusD family nutrient uptake outer membrane protein [Sediminibacterium roseum]|uniref:RagB/SusD family nutrient uptake outer membrane protein n=1 Tax=Sediminibacterium roseum TaxID=1978412 RepID=A0ABW9ZRE8_9BACT|nr:RagB/SusD family nutrient uptake outer membrane protein [Sediminibacterium roseum]NCI49682.1 RagB/SusD family nutrient uptake outer membrane protein [Sediminibacterium roseum]
MKNTIKASFLLAVIAFGTLNIVGCKKSWLEPKTLSLFSPENTLVDLPGFKAALAAASNNLKAEWYGDGSPNISEQIFSEESVEGTDDKTGPAQNMDLQIKPEAQLRHVDFNNIGWFWETQYNGIRAANIILGRVEESKLTDAEKNMIKGQAYFLRGYDFYRLTNQFGDVPAPTKELRTPKVDFVTVKREVILQRAKADIESTIAAVPWVTDRGEINRAACYHLLTKINLSLGLFDDAIASATAVINQGTYKLMKTRFGVDANITTKNVTWDLHRPDNKSAAANTEGLYIVTDRLGVANNIQTNSMRNAAPGVSIGTNIITPAGRAGMTASAGVEIDLMQIYGRGIGRCRSTSYHYREIWDDPKDWRHDSVSGNWMYMENLVYANPALKGVDTAYGRRLRLFDPNQNNKLLCSDTLRSWYPWPHYKLYVPDSENVPMRGGHSDWYVFRLAETYLLRAEAYVWKGDQTNALADINAVRTRANCDAYTNIAKATIATVLDERARELYYEEPRKTELTRIAYIYAKTGKVADNGKTYTLANFSTSNFWYDRVMEKNVFYAKNFITAHGDMMKISPYHVLWPIPQPAINANTGNRLNQNAGYNGFAGNVAPSDKIVD